MVLLEEAKIRSLDDTVLLVGGEAVVVVVVVDLVVLTSTNIAMSNGGVANFIMKLTLWETGEFTQCPIPGLFLIGG